MLSGPAGRRVSSLLQEEHVERRHAPDNPRVLASAVCSNGWRDCRSEIQHPRTMLNVWVLLRDCQACFHLRAPVFTRVPDHGLGLGLCSMTGLGGMILSGLGCGGCNEEDGGLGVGEEGGDYPRASKPRSPPPYGHQAGTLDPHTGDHQAANVQESPRPLPYSVRCSRPRI